MIKNGVKLGDCVVIVMWNYLEWMFFYWVIVVIGVVVVGMNVWWVIYEMFFGIEDVMLKVIIGD